MGCCSTGSGCSLDIDRAVEFSNGTHGVEAKGCSSCQKLHSYDLDTDLLEKTDKNIFEVRFKNTRKGYFRNVSNLFLEAEDVVVVEGIYGYDIGVVSMIGPLVARQIAKYKFPINEIEFKTILRKATSNDISKWQNIIAKEYDTKIKANAIAIELNLNMKITDVEFQGDGNKAIFSYIADERVDFRQLIRSFADKFRVKVDMKQIGARQEAGLIGGIGSCGREMCCSSWITHFVSVTTDAAKNQGLGLNMEKLAGQCGKLKCCLSYEDDMYIKALKKIPRVREAIKTSEGIYYHVKTDVLKSLMWFSSEPKGNVNLVELTAETVRDILKKIADGENIDSFLDKKNEVTNSSLVRASNKLSSIDSDDMNFRSDAGEDSINRFDRSKKARSGGGNKNRNKNRDKNRDSSEAKKEGVNTPVKTEKNEVARDKTAERSGDRNRSRGGYNSKSRNSNSSNNSSKKPVKG